jgi:prepilin-type N-terminal cleavage/methylation domain-containing protein
LSGSPGKNHVTFAKNSIAAALKACRWLEHRSEGDVSMLPPMLMRTRKRTRRSASAAGFARGFTLIEIAVVLFLMGLMMLIAMPYFGGITDSQLRSVTRRLAGRATFLFDEATARKLVIQLVFDMDHNGYFVLTADPYAPQPTFFPDSSPSGARVLLPDAVRIRDVTVEGVGTLGKGTIATQFYPQGYADATVIHLIDTKGRVMTLRIDPLTGQVAIARGDLRVPGT